MMQILTQTVLLCITIGAAISLAYRDFKIINQGKHIKHAKNVLERIVLLSASVWIAHLSGLIWYWALQCYFTVGMIVFDISLNKFRGLDWYYLGTDNSTSVLDKVKRSIPGYWYFAIVLFIGAVSMYYFYGIDGLYY